LFRVWKFLQNKPAAGGHQIAVDISRALAESRAGDVLAENHLLIIGQKIFRGIVLFIVFIQIFFVIILGVAVNVISTFFGLLVGGFALK